MKHALKNRLASALGSSFEWYDFALYNFFISTFSLLYFPGASPFTSMIHAFMLSFVSFAARPLGAIFFGIIGDRYGRARTLKLTPLLIMIPAVIFPFIPTYSNAGLFAPILLCCLRIFQGFCIGGEFACNIVYLCESSKKDKIYFWGSIGSCTGSFGIFLASLVAAFIYSWLSETQIQEYGWRIAFLFGTVINFISLILRRSLTETNSYSSLASDNKISLNPLKESLKNNLGIYFFCLGFLLIHVTSFYFSFFFLPAYLAEIMGSQYSLIMKESTLSFIIRFLAIPLMGLIAQRIGGVKMMLFSSILFITASYPLFNFLTQNAESQYAVLFSMLCLAIMTSVNAATIPGLLVNIIPEKLRCTIFSISFNIGFGIFGGITPLICFYLIEITGYNFSSVAYLIFISSVTLLTCFLWISKNEVALSSNLNRQYNSNL